MTAAANAGTGTGLIFRDIVSNTLNLRSLKQGTGITIVTSGNEVTIGAAAFSDVYWLNPIISIFDNTAGPPVPSIVGESYMALVTAHGWTANNIYTWNGTSWDETIAANGMTVYDEDTAVLYKFDGVVWNPGVGKGTPNQFPIFVDVNGHIGDSRMLQYAQTGTAGVRLSSPVTTDDVCYTYYRNGQTRLWLTLDGDMTDDFTVNMYAGPGEIFRIKGDGTGLISIAESNPAGASAVKLYLNGSMMLSGSGASDWRIITLRNTSNNQSIIGAINFTSTDLVPAVPTYAFIQGNSLTHENPGGDGALYFGVRKAATLSTVLTLIGSTSSDGKVILGLGSDRTTPNIASSLDMEGRLFIGTSSTTGNIYVDPANNSISAGWNSATDGYPLYLNFYGYQGVDTKSRDTFIADGQGYSIIHVEGSSFCTTFGDINPATDSKGLLTLRSTTNALTKQLAANVGPTSAVAGGSYVTSTANSCYTRKDFGTLTDGSTLKLIVSPAVGDFLTGSGFLMGCQGGSFTVHRVNFSFDLFGMTFLAAIGAVTNIDTPGKLCLYFDDTDNSLKVKNNLGYDIELGYAVDYFILTPPAS